MSNQLNLRNLINELTEDDIDKILVIIGYRCRVKTCIRLRSVLTYPTGLKMVGIFERLIKEPDGRWHYCAGQSYTDEIRTLRECLL